MITSFRDIIAGAGVLLKLLIPLTAAVALLYFFWGLAQFILVSGDEKLKTQGRSKMTWGVVALFVMTSIWGIIGFLQKDLIGGTGPSTLPVVQNR